MEGRKEGRKEGRSTRMDTLLISTFWRTIPKVHLDRSPAVFNFSLVLQL